jgi:hypothetical protein
MTAAAAAIQQAAGAEPLSAAQPPHQSDSGPTTDNQREDADRGQQVGRKPKSWSSDDDLAGGVTAFPRVERDADDITRPPTASAADSIDRPEPSRKMRPAADGHRCSDSAENQPTT